MAGNPEQHRGGRRWTDNISADIRLAIEESAAETRHTLRPEIAAVAARVEAGSLLQTKEHAEVKAAIANLADDIAEIKQWRTSLRTYVISLGVLIVGATGLLAGLLQH